MSTFPTFNSYSLQDINGTGVLTSNIKKFQIPQRDMQYEAISRRPGTRILNNEYRNKTIQITGHILADNPTDLRNKIDALHREVSIVEEGSLALSSDRIGTATLTDLQFEENTYNTSYVPFSMTLIMTDPFFYDAQKSVSFTIASGVSTHTENITISGSFFSNPSITLSVNGSTGDTQTQRIGFSYDSTGETIVWSGGVGEEYIGYGDSLQIDYNKQFILRNSETENTSGSFAEWDPGERNLTITFSGIGDWVGGDVTFAYQPRYI